MDLSNVQMSTHDGPTRVAVHSGEGVGKTTLAAHFPAPIFVGAELGIPRDLGFAVPIVQPKAWVDVFGVVQSLIDDDHQYETLVLDTVDWLEPLIHLFVCKRDSDRKTEMNPKGHVLLSIEDYGYGKGFLAAEEEFRKLIVKLDELQTKRGMHVVMLMHSGVRTFENPTGPNFDRFEGKPHKRITRVVVEWAEHVFFLFFDMVAGKIPDDVARNEKGAKAKGMGSGQRMVGTRWSTAYDAKNRLGLEPELPLNEPGELADLVGRLTAGNTKTGRAPAERPSKKRAADPPGAIVQDRVESVAARDHRQDRSTATAEDRRDDYRGAQQKPEPEPKREPEAKTRAPDPSPSPAPAPSPRDVAPAAAPANGKKLDKIDPAIAAAATRVIDRARQLGGEPMRKRIADWCRLANEGGVQVVERINKLDDYLDTQYPASKTNHAQEQRQ